MKRIALVVAWVVATFATALVAWSAVRLAGDQVGERPVEPLSAAEVAALPVDTAPAPSGDVLSNTTTTGVAAGLPPATVPAGPDLTVTEPSGVPPPATAADPASDASSKPDSPSVTSTTSTTGTTQPPAPAGTAPPVATTSPTTSTTTTTTVAPPAATETKAFHLRGGSVVIEVSPGRVVLRSATPRTGYSMDIQNSGPRRVEVEFEGEDDSSEFRAEWSGGALEVDIDE